MASNTNADNKSEMPINEVDKTVEQPSLVDSPKTMTTPDREVVATDARNPNAEEMLSEGKKSDFIASVVETPVVGSIVGVVTPGGGSVVEEVPEGDKVSERVDDPADEDADVDADLGVDDDDSWMEEDEPLAVVPYSAVSKGEVNLGGSTDSPKPVKPAGGAGSSQAEKKYSSDDALKDLLEMQSIAKISRGQGSKLAKEVSSDEEDLIVISESPAVSRTPRSGKKRAFATRYQPHRSGKGPKTSEKKRKAEEVSEPEGEGKPKEVLDEFLLTEEFFEKEKLDEVFELLKFQGWEHLFSKEEVVDKAEVLEFYKDVRKSSKGVSLFLDFEFKGEELGVTSMEIAAMLGLEHEGFDVFAKGAWPEKMTLEERREMQIRVCNVSDTSQTAITTTLMEPKMKILHKLLVSNILPRGSKPSLAQIQDILVLDQIAQKKKVNLPKLIIHQMEYISKFRQVGLARFVKRILQLQRVYEPKLEVSVSKPLEKIIFTRLNVKYGEKEGCWIRDPKRQKVEVLKAEEPKVGGSQSEEPDVMAKLGKMESVLVEFRGELQSITDSMHILEVDVRNIKKAVDTVLAELRKA